MTILLILVVVAYLLIGIVEALGVCATYMFEPKEFPSLGECLLITVGWGIYEYVSWRRKRSGR